MRRLSLCLNALAGMRDATGGMEGLRGVAVLAELAGAEALRLGVAESLRPVSDADVVALRHATRCVELRMAASQHLLRVALEARPDRVVLSAAGTEEGGLRPVDPRKDVEALSGLARTLEDAGIPTHLCVAPRVDAVKASHQLGVAGVELYTGNIVDLPARERRSELERLADAARLTEKLGIELGLAGDLDDRILPSLLAAAPAVDRVVVGTAAVGRAVQVGIDRAVRDLVARIA